MKQTWKLLHQAIGKQNDKSNFPQSFKINDETITDQSIIVK